MSGRLADTPPGRAPRSRKLLDHKKKADATVLESEKAGTSKYIEDLQPGVAAGGR